jgi:hypothetical protein
MLNGSAFSNYSAFRRGRVWFADRQASGILRRQRSSTVTPATDTDTRKA